MLRRQLVYVRDACVVHQTAPRRVIFSFTTSEKVDLSRRTRDTVAAAAARAAHGHVSGVPNDGMSHHIG